jgi:hypothetical protein
MRILTVHNFYTQPGGEDTAFRAEAALLRAYGHRVLEYTVRNQRIASSNKLSLAIQTVWSWESYRAIEETIRRRRPDIVHFHNTFPLVSPAAYYACRKHGIPVVQSLYNPRLMCPASTFYRNGHLCTDCLGRFPWPGIVHACYRKSRAQTLAVATMLGVHRVLRTWSETVSMYLVATEFYRELFTTAGLPRSRLFVKPNFVVSDAYRQRRKPGD